MRDFCHYRSVVVSKVLRTLGVLLVAGGFLLLTAQIPANATSPAAASQPIRPAAQPATTSNAYTITLVARVCSAYTDVMANRGRNNLQESLQDLGKDSVYQTGQPVDPTIEESNDLNCQPLDGWKFTMGNSPNGPKVNHLSTVTNGGAPTAATATVPLLDTAGNDTGQTIDGAVTVTLTPAQVAAAQNRQVYFQGGTPTDPLLNALFPGQYGFAALRCATDNYNADNVEWTSFPTEYHHLFCYEYVVTPPSNPATIIVRKQLQGGTDGPGSFRYVGNISYTATNDFYLTADTGVTSSATFVRAAGLPWDFTEQPLTGWTLVSVACTPGAGTVITGARVVVTPAPNTTVTCTYVNERDPTGALELDKTTLGAVGSFPFHVTGPPPAAPLDVTATTTTQGVATPVLASAGSTPGNYTATETLPAVTGAGSWDLSSAECDGTDVTGSVVSNGQQRTLSHTVLVGAPAICNMTNTFTPTGSIAIRKTTQGGVGTFTYVVDDLLDPSNPTFVGQQQATTTTTGTPVTATGDALDGLYASDPNDAASSAHPYAIGEIAPADTSAGSWRLTSVRCSNGLTRQALNGYVTLDLTTTDPHVTCDFINTFVPTATLHLSKIVIDPDAVRTGPVTIHLTCEDGTDLTLTGPAGHAGPFALEPLVFRDPTTCTVTETATGVGAGASVATKIALNDGGVTTVDASKITFPVRSGHDINVAITDTYAAAPVEPSVAPSPGASVLPTEESQGSPLPNTGAPDTRPFALWGVFLVLLGVALFASSTARRPRANRTPRV